MGELFKDVENIDEIEGRLYVYGRTVDVAGGTLRLAGNLLTSLPIMYELHGFQPSAEIQFNTLLEGTSPAVTFRIRQFVKDLSLDNVEVDIPNVHFDPSPLKGLDEGTPFMMADSGDTRGTSISSLGFVDSIAEDGTTLIGMQQITNEGLIPIAELTLSDGEKGVKALLQLLNRKPNTYVYESLDLQILFPSGLFQLPEGAQSFSSETQFVSVSTSRRSNQPMVEINRQSISTITLGSSNPQIIHLTPFQGRVDAPISITGINIPKEGDLQVLFPNLEGNFIAAKEIEQEDQKLVAIVPDGIASGGVILRADGLESNAYKYRMMFGPKISFSFNSLAAESSPSFTWNLSQVKGELALHIWKMFIQGANLDTSNLTTGQKMGKFIWKSTQYGWEEEYELIVDSVTGNEIVLKDSNYGLLIRIAENSSGDIIIEKLAESDPLTPQFITSGVMWKWEVTTPLISLPSSGLIDLKTEATSMRYSINSNSKYKTYESAVFQVE
jgi:hypothetical protein